MAKLLPDGGGGIREGRPSDRGDAVAQLWAGGGATDPKNGGGWGPQSGAREVTICPKSLQHELSVSYQPFPNTSTASVASNTSATSTISITSALNITSASGVVARSQ